MKISIKEILWLSLSALLTAFAVQFFFVPHSLTPGGITGMSISLSTLLNIEVSVISLSVSIPLLIISTIFLGGKFGVKTLFITLMVPVFLNFIPIFNVFEEYRILAAVCGGILVGSSIAIAINNTCATGGTDVIAMLINKIIKKMKLAHILFILDFIIVLSSWMLTKDFMTALYSGLALFVIMQVISFGTKLKKSELA